jgi:hypothetical protein
MIKVSLLESLAPPQPGTREALNAYKELLDPLKEDFSSAVANTGVSLFSLEDGSSIFPMITQEGYIYELHEPEAHCVSVFFKGTAPSSDQFSTVPVEPGIHYANGMILGVLIFYLSEMENRSVLINRVHSLVNDILAAPADPA